MMDATNWTGFPEAEEELRRQLQRADLDHSAFQQPFAICELQHCRGNCCHDGVILAADERRAISAILSKCGRNVDLLFERRGLAWKSRSVKVPVECLPTDYPAHFPSTRCVFLDENHHCQLQVISEQIASHPWFWKPISCWMHPLVILPESAHTAPLLTIPNRTTDPQCRADYEGFASFTTCGSPQTGSPPAWVTFGEELRLLGQISGRDILGELQRSEGG